MTVDNGTGTDYGVASDKVTFSGDADQAVQLFRPVHVSGSEGSKTVNDITNQSGLMVEIVGGAGFAEVEDGTNAADAYALNAIPGLIVHDFPHVFNGTNWDRLRGDAAGGMRVQVFGNEEGTPVAIEATSNRLQVNASVYQVTAHGAADIGGGPIKVGGYASSIPLTGLANGDVSNAWHALNGAAVVDGGVLHDAVDSGNPIKIGGKANDGSQTPVANGDRVDAWFDGWGALNTNAYLQDGGASGGVANILATGADAVPNSTDLLWTGAAGYVFNGTDWDRLRGNTGGVFVNGQVAHDVADVGNPLKIGGKAGTSINPTAVAASDRVDAHFDTKGRLGVFIASSYDGTGAVTGNTPADAFTATAGLNTNTLLSGFNGSTWDRLRSDTTNGLDVDVTRVSGTVTVAGGAAHASPVSGNPNLMAGRASTVIPTDVGADGDVASMWTNRSGAQVVTTAPHIGLNSDPWNLVHEAAQYTSAQTSTVLVAGGASEKIVVTKVQIQAFATTAGTAILYFGTGAFSRGTSRAVFDGEFAPSSTLKPGVVMDGPFIAGTNGDDLMVTTTNALSITFNVWYYVVT